MANVFLAACLVMSVSCCTSLNKAAGLKDDNDVEKRIEEMIEQETGVKVDLTPEAKKEDTQSSTSTKNDKK